MIITASPAAPTRTAPPAWLKGRTSAKKIDGVDYVKSKRLLSVESDSVVAGDCAVAVVAVAGDGDVVAVAVVVAVVAVVAAAGEPNNNRRST